jgi:choline-sulfatase
MGIVRVSPLVLALAAAELAGCARRVSAEEQARADGGAPVAEGMTSGKGSSPKLTRPVVASTSPMNVLFLTVDSLRADMPWAGYPRPIAPNLTAWAAKSTVYTNAYSISSFTSKSTAGFLTGRFPSELSRTGGFFTHYKESNVFLCETLAEQSIPCLAGQAHNYLDKAYGAGIDQGFTDWRIVPGITFDFNKDPWITSQKLTPLAISMLHQEQYTGNKPDGSAHPFFAWFHYMDPHHEYFGHEESPHYGHQRRDMYDEEVFYTDLWVKKLLDDVDQQPWAKNTVIVLSADHGEAFGEHGRYRHAYELYQELVHVPLIVHMPGQTEGRTIDVPRSQIDLVPTFAEVLGAHPPAGVDGVSLAAEWRGGEPAPQRDIITDLPEDEFNERRRTFMHGTLKLIAKGNDQHYELYDLATDPKELHDLMGKDKDQTHEMLAMYKAASGKLADIPPVGGIPKHDPQ